MKKLQVKWINTIGLKVNNTILYLHILKFSNSLSRISIADLSLRLAKSRSTSALLSALLEASNFWPAAFSEATLGV